MFEQGMRASSKLSKIKAALKSVTSRVAIQRRCQRPERLVLGQCDCGGTAVKKAATSVGIAVNTLGRWTDAGTCDNELQSAHL